MAILLPENNSNPTFTKEFELSLNEEKLNYLLQIKSELEALKLIKDKLILSVETKTTIDEISGVSITGYWLVEGDCCKAYAIIEQKEYETLKKALEVENE